MTTSAMKTYGTDSLTASLALAAILTVATFSFTYIGANFAPDLTATYLVVTQSPDDASLRVLGVGGTVTQELEQAKGITAKLTEDQAGWLASQPGVHRIHQTYGD